jgi:CubicO group peptidase (beta-lactamase class C family)
MSRELADPARLGVDPARLDLLRRRVRLEVESGRLPSCQMALAMEGRLVAFDSFGDTTPSTRYILQSASRPVLAAVLWKLIGEGRVDPSDRVASIVPEFGTRGKDVVSVEQVATHTAGFPFAPLGYPKMLDRKQRLAAFAKWRLDYEPGTRLQWHLTSAAWILAEIVERVTSLPFPEYLRTQLVEPLGLDIELGVPVERQRGSVAPMVATDRRSDDEKVDPWGPWFLSDPNVLAAGEPSHSVVATAADAALFYQALFHSGLWTLEAITEGTRIRVTAAPAGEAIYGGSRLPVSVGLFTVVRGDHPGGGLPATASPRAFGMFGAPCQFSFMDPDVGLSFAFVTNGYPLAGYDHSRAGRNCAISIGNLAADVLA